MKSQLPVAAAIRVILWVAAAVFYSNGLSLMAANPAGASVSRANSAGANALTASGTNEVLGVNDLIKIEVYRLFKDSNLARETRIDQEGNVALPLIQTVKVGGRSVAEAREEIKRLYEKDYLVTADVNLVLVQSAQTNKVAAIEKKDRFTILGQVKRPGNFEIPQGETLSILQAIAMAEGFTSIARRNKVTVNRKVETTGKLEQFIVDVRAMMTDTKLKPFEIKPGDVISVEESVF